MRRLIYRATLSVDTPATRRHLWNKSPSAHPLSRAMSTSSPTYLTLSSGQKMPFIGLGLWKAEQGSVGDVVVQAIQAGYRHFDSASDYGNEQQTGAGIQKAIDSGLVKREELFITSKLWCTDHGREHVKPALERILSDLQLDYLDLFLIHFPISLEYVDPKVVGRTAHDTGGECGSGEAVFSHSSLVCVWLCSLSATRLAGALRATRSTAK